MQLTTGIQGTLAARRALISRALSSCQGIARKRQIRNRHAITRELTLRTTDYGVHWIQEHLFDDEIQNDEY